MLQGVRYIRNHAKARYVGRHSLYFYILNKLEKNDLLYSLLLPPTEQLSDHPKKQVDKVSTNYFIAR